MKLSKFIPLLFLISTAHAGYQVKSSLTYMQKLAPLADCLVKNQGFRAEVSLITKFTYSDKTGLQVVKDFDDMKDITLRTYWYYNRSVIATTYSKNRTELYFNTRANPRAVKNMINTVIHETRHLLGDGHGSNSPKGKEHSIPYWVGKIAEKYVSECTL